MALDHALSHMAKAQGILTHIRSIAPIASRDRSVLVPTDVLLKVSLVLIEPKCYGPTDCFPVHPFSTIFPLKCSYGCVRVVPLRWMTQR